MTLDDPRLSRWLVTERAELPCPEPARVLPGVLARIATTPQARPRTRWGLGRTSSPSTAGRVSAMFTAPRMVTLVAIAAIGTSALLFSIAQPRSVPPGTGPAVLASAGPSPEATPAPAWVTGTAILAPDCSDPTLTIEGGVQIYRGYRCEPQTWTTDDPRLTGQVISTWNADVYSVDNASVSLTAGTYELHNDGGGWQCQYAAALANGAGLTTLPVSDEILTCTGTAGYQGLTAILVLDWAAAPVSITGMVFSGTVPPVP